MPADARSARALRRLRCFWAGSVVAVLSGTAASCTAPWLGGAVSPAVAALIAGAAVGLAFPVRMQQYKRAWRGDAVTAEGYARGAGLFFLIVATGTGTGALLAPLPTGPAIGIAGALALAASFPGAAPTIPTHPRRPETEP